MELLLLLWFEPSSTYLRPCETGGRGACDSAGARRFREEVGLALSVFQLEKLARWQLSRIDRQVRSKSGFLAGCNQGGQPPNLARLLVIALQRRNADARKGSRQTI
jgi:hypothetical protein